MSYDNCCFNSSKNFNSLKEKISNGSVKVNFNGHGIKKYKNIDFFNKNYCSEFLILDKGDEELFNKLLEQKDCNDYVLTHKSCLTICYVCGEELQFSFNGRECKIVDKCKYCKKIPNIELFLDIPSGKMVVANDLREYFSEAEEICSENCHDLCSVAGLIETTEDYIKESLFHAFVGNSCPKMLQRDNSFVITNKKLKNYKKEVAYICTDLWWVCVCDYDVFVEKAKKIPGKYETIVECKPGKYKFTHFAHKSIESKIFTKIDFVE